MSKTKSSAGGKTTISSANLDDVNSKKRSSSNNAIIISSFFQFYQDNPVPSILLNNDDILEVNKAFIDTFSLTVNLRQKSLSDLFSQSVLDQIRLNRKIGGEIFASKEDVKFLNNEDYSRLDLRLIKLAEENFSLLLFNPVKASISDNASAFADGIDSHKVMDVILSSVPIGVFAYDADGHILYANSKFWEMMGYNNNTPAGLNLFQLTGIKNHELKDKLIQATKAKEIVSFETIYASKNLGELSLKATLVPITDSGDEVRSVVVLLEDTSAQLQVARTLEYERQMMKNLLENIPDTIYFKDEHSRFTLINKAHSNILKLQSPEQAIGKSDFDFYDESHANVSYRDEQKIMATGKGIIDKTEKFHMSDGTLRCVSSTKVPFVDGENKVVGLVGISRNITERVLLDEELMKLNESLTLSKLQLEEKTTILEVVNSQLESSQKELEEINASKDKFFSIIAHDLKSPFQGLLGISSILADDSDVLTPQEFKHYLVSMNQTLKDTFNLIENLLSWARLQSGRMQMMKETLNLGKVVNNIIEILLPGTLKKNIRMESLIEPSVKVYADSNMLRSMIQNLISNAIKFTPSGGRILISSQNNANRLDIKIKDNGIGMSPTEQEMIFRIDKNHTTLGTAGEKGTGLGVLLLKEMIERHGGNISVNSIRGKGTEFILSFPLI